MRQKIVQAKLEKTTDCNDFKPKTTVVHHKMHNHHQLGWWAGHLMISCPRCIFFQMHQEMYSMEQLGALQDSWCTMMCMQQRKKVIRPPFGRPRGDEDENITCNGCAFWKKNSAKNNWFFTLILKEVYFLGHHLV